ncbi:MAG: GDP-mannose 4,6-dehydratase [Sumerlaeia bacterium]
MNILLTGAGGFVASHCIDEFVSCGHTLWATSRRPFADPRLETGEALVADLTDADEVRAVVSTAKPEIIVHLAAQSNPAHSWAIPEATFQTNVFSTAHLTRAAGELLDSPLLIFASSSDVYGRPEPNELPLTERSPIRPHTPYAASKVAAEHMAKVVGKRFGCRVVIVRPFSHTGPGQTEKFVVPAFARQIAMVEAGFQKRLGHGNISSHRDFTDARDVARAYRLIAEANLSAGTFNICSGKSYSIEEILDLMLTLTVSPVESVLDPDRYRDEKASELSGDASLVREVVGWEPRISLKQTLFDVLAEQRAQVGLLAERTP